MKLELVCSGLVSVLPSICDLGLGVVICWGFKTGRLDEGSAGKERKVQSWMFATGLEVLAGALEVGY